MSEILVGRQPIFDARLEAVGYELFFQGSQSAEQAGVPDSDAATSRVLLNTFFELGAERVIGDKLAFVSLSRGSLLGGMPLALDPDQVVLQVPEAIAAEAAVLRALDALREGGFRLVLDDYRGAARHEPFLDHVDMVKVGRADLPPDSLNALVDDLAGRGLRLLAKQVDTRSELEHFRGLGFELFQGYFLMQPETLSGRSIPSRRLALLRLLGRLYDPAVEIEELSELVAQDVALAFRLLRHVNSVAFGFRRHISLVRDALMALGLERTRAIVSLLVVSSIDDKPSELVQYALIRGRMCELIARRIDAPRSKLHFTTGLFSVLDALTDMPMEQIVAQLPLAENVNAALLGRPSGKLGAVLEVVRAYERSNWAEACIEGVGAMDLLDDFYAAISYAHGLEVELAGAA